MEEDHLGGSDNGGLHSRSRPQRSTQNGAGRNRKMLRKQERRLKKTKRLAYNLHKPIATMIEKSEKSKKRPDSKNSSKTKALSGDKSTKPTKKEIRKSTEKATKTPGKKKQAEINRLLRENAEEDRLIKKLEKKLYLNKRKKKKKGKEENGDGKTKLPASFKNDGLAYLLEVLDDPSAELNASDEEMDDQNDIDGSESDLNDFSDHPSINPDEEIDTDDLSNDEMEDSDNGNLQQTSDRNSDEEMDVSVSEINQKEDDDLNEEENGDSDAEIEDNQPKMDIYGRLRDSKGKLVESEPVVRKYVPPALKNDNNGSELLKRQVKGLINRLTSNNIVGICKQMMELYGDHARHDVNETICGAMISSCVGTTLTPKRMIVEHALLMGILYQNAGQELGAMLVQKLLGLYDSGVSKLTQGVSSPDDKTLDNVVLLWCHLHSFKIIHSAMVFEMLSECCQRFDEKDVDLILQALREIGFPLRKEDPSALGKFIEEIQSKADSLRSTPNQIGSRLSFMLDIVKAIKNNNMTKIPNYDPSELEQAQKIYRSSLRKGQLIEAELRIGLQDLRNADQKGRWWIVGAAWNNRTPNESDHKDGKVVEDEMNNRVKKGELGSQFATKKLLELAAKQRMNTDVRRAIFCAVLSAEDFDEAFEHILKLNLTSAQEPELFHVLVHCCLNEKTFNPFYALVIEKVCASHRKFQRMLQFCLWDKMSDLPSLTTGQLSNLVELICHNLIHNAIPLTVLKKLNFADMNKVIMGFLRKLLAELILRPKDDQLTTMFSKVSGEKVAAFKESLRLFIRHFMLRSSEKVLKGEFKNVNVGELERKVGLCEKALTGQPTLDL